MQRVGGVIYQGNQWVQGPEEDQSLAHLEGTERIVGSLKEAGCGEKCALYLTSCSSLNRDEGSLTWTSRHLILVVRLGFRGERITPLSAIPVFLEPARGRWDEISCLEPSLNSLKDPFFSRPGLDLLKMFFYSALKGFATADTKPRDITITVGCFSLG